MKSWWNDAKIEDAVAAWTPFAGRITTPEVDDRFRKEIGSIGPAEMALVMGYRLAVAHGHCEANQTPGPFAAIWALRGGFPVGWLPEGPGVPIASVSEHVTGTGRLRWEAKGDGTILIQVWRGPSASSDPHLVLSAIVRAEARADDYNSGIVVDCTEVEAHGAFGVRHVDTLLGAISMAMGADHNSYEEELLRARVAALGDPEPDLWDPANAPAVPPVGTRVRVVPESYNNPYLARVTGATAEWDWYQRGWTLLVEAEEGGWGRYALVREIRPEPEAETPEA